MLDDQASSIKKLRLDIERAHGKVARRDAQRLADRTTEFFGQKLNHEFKKVATTLQIAIANVKSGAQKPDLDRERLLEDANAASSALNLLLSVVGSACDLADRVPPKFKPENLRAIVIQATELLRDRIDARRLDLDVDVDENLVLDVDRGKLLQALSNVFQNAAEAYPSDGDAPIRIRVAARLRAATQVALTIADEGCGIGANELPHVFAPFGSSKPGVRGLGLLNVQRMIESVHGGDVHLESTRGIGTTVTLTLPRKQKP
jgi:signal transduction histidine kinase